MAYLTPQIQSITAFDASIGSNIYFSSTGDQYSHVNVVISTNDSAETSIINEIIPTFLSRVPVAPGVLTNGTEYKAQVRVGDGTNWSEYSDSVIFRCFSSPVIAITNITNGTIGNQNYTFTGSYSQAEGDSICSYKFDVYDSNQIQISTSGERFTINPELISYFVSGFQNDERYYIRLTCKSQSGMETQTGLIAFVASFIQPRMYSALDIENQIDEGRVRINAILRQISGVGENHSFVSDEWVDVTGENAYVLFDEGLSITHPNYMLQMWLKGISPGKTFMTITSTHGSEINLFFEENRVHGVCSANGITSHYCNSRDVEVTATDEFSIVLRVVDNAADIYVIKDGDIY